MRALGDAFCKFPRIGTALGIDDRNDAIVFTLSVAGGKTGDDFVGSRNWLGINHRGAGMKIAEPGHLRRAVRVHRPEMMEMNLAAVHVFPPGVENTSVR